MNSATKRILLGINEIRKRVHDCGTGQWDSSCKDAKVNEMKQLFKSRLEYLGTYYKSVKSKSAHLHLVALRYYFKCILIKTSNKLSYESGKTCKSDLQSRMRAIHTHIRNIVIKVKIGVKVATRPHEQKYRNHLLSYDRDMSIRNLQSFKSFVNGKKCSVLVKLLTRKLHGLQGPIERSDLCNGVSLFEMPLLEKTTTIVKYIKERKDQLRRCRSSVCLTGRQPITVNISEKNVIFSLPKTDCVATFVQSSIS